MARACVYITSMNLVSIVHLFLTEQLVQNNRYNYPPTEENQPNALSTDLPSALSHNLRRCDNAIIDEQVKSILSNEGGHPFSLLAPLPPSS